MVDRSNVRFDRNRDNKKREEKSVYINEDIIKYLLDPESKDLDLYTLFNEESGIIKNQFDILGGSQLRKFYNAVVDINDKYEGMKMAKAKLAMMLPIVYYSTKRGLLDKGNIIFTFINKSIKTLNSINDEKQFRKSLEAFKNVFQAVIAYTK